MAEIVNLGLPPGALSYVDSLAESLGITNFVDRDTIGVLPTTAIGSYYISNFEPDFFEYYILSGENITAFIKRIDNQQLEESNAKICFLKEDEIKTYFTIESDDFSMRPFENYAPPIEGGIMIMDYTPQQMDFLEQTYGDTEPELQLNLQSEQTPSNIGIQNSVVGEQISYNSLSSLGAISQEGFTISATTGSVTGLITEQTETITDVGGLSGAGRDSTIIGGGVGGADVTTRGY